MRSTLTATAATVFHEEARKSVDAIYVRRIGDGTAILVRIDQVRGGEDVEVKGYHKTETQALTGSAKERKVLKTHRRERLLLLDCSRDRSAGFRNQICGRIGTGASEWKNQRGQDRKR